MMSYTLPWSNQWVGAHTYRGFTDRVAELNSWSSKEMSDRRSVHGVFTPEGDIRWAMGLGTVRAEDGLLDHRNHVVLEGASDTIDVVPIRPKGSSRGTVDGLVFPLPEGIDATMLHRFHGVMEGEDFGSSMDQVIDLTPDAPGDPRAVPGVYRIFGR